MTTDSKSTRPRSGSDARTPHELIQHGHSLTTRAERGARADRRLALLFLFLTAPTPGCMVRDNDPSYLSDDDHGSSERALARYDDAGEEGWLLAQLVKATNPDSPAPNPHPDFYSCVYKDENLSASAIVDLDAAIRWRDHVQASLTEMNNALKGYNDWPVASINVVDISAEPYTGCPSQHAGLIVIRGVPRDVGAVFTGTSTGGGSGTIQLDKCRFEDRNMSASDPLVLYHELMHWARLGDLYLASPSYTFLERDHSSMVGGIGPLLAPCSAGRRTVPAPSDKWGLRKVWDKLKDDPDDPDDPNDFKYECPPDFERGVAAIYDNPGEGRFAQIDHVSNRDGLYCTYVRNRMFQTQSAKCMELSTDPPTIGLNSTCGTGLRQQWSIMEELGVDGAPVVYRIYNRYLDDPSGNVRKCLEAALSGDSVAMVDCAGAGDANFERQLWLKTPDYGNTYHLTSYHRSTHSSPNPRLGQVSGTVRMVSTDPSHWELHPWTKDPETVAGSNLVLWLDATDIDLDKGPTNHRFGAPVTAWRSKVGSHVASAVTTIPPSVGRNAFRLPTVRFWAQPGAGMSIPHSLALDHGGAYTICAAATTRNAWDGFILEKGAQYSLKLTSDGKIGSSSAYSGAWAVPEKELKVHCVRASKSGSFTYVDIFVNGQRVLNSDSVSPISNDGANILLGKMRGEVGEILVYNTSLALTEIEILSEYLMFKWGLLRPPPNCDSMAGVLLNASNVVYPFMGNGYYTLDPDGVDTGNSPAPILCDFSADRTLNLSQVSGFLSDAGAGAAGDLWGTSPSGQTWYYQWQGVSSWHHPSGTAHRADVDDYGIAWVANTDNGSVYYQSSPASPGTWGGIGKPGEGATDIGVGTGGVVWAISHDLIYHYVAGRWERANGNGVRIAVDKNDVPWVVDAWGNVWKGTSSSSSTNWVIAGHSSHISAKDVAIDDNNDAWVITTKGDVLKHVGVPTYDDRTQWVTYYDNGSDADDLRAITVAGATPVVVKNDGTIWVASKRVFVTAGWYQGNLGGLAGADAKCQERANTQGLGGAWKAWLSDSTVLASARMVRWDNKYSDITRITGIASSWSDLTDGTLSNPIDHTEHGTPVYWKNHLVWTNTNYAGVNTTEHCNGWTSSLSSDQGYGGRNDLTSNGLWTCLTTAPCDEFKLLYCVEQ